MQKLIDFEGEDLHNLINNKSTADIKTNFKYKLYWYNNFEISIASPIDLKFDAKQFIESEENKSKYNDDYWPIYWDSNDEIKGRDDDRIFQYLRSIINGTGHNMKIDLNCSDIDYSNNYSTPKEDDLEASLNYSQQFHDK